MARTKRFGVAISLVDAWLRQIPPLLWIDEGRRTTALALSIIWLWSTRPRHPLVKERCGHLLVVAGGGGFLQMFQHIDGTHGKD
jgi:hypothetical protein